MAQGLTGTKVDTVGQVFTNGTLKTSTSGSTIDFDIPLGARLVAVMLDGVSLSGTDNITISLGDAGGIESTGYDSHSTEFPHGSAFATTDSTTSFTIGITPTAGQAISGMLLLTLTNKSTFHWTASGNFAIDGANTTSGIVAGNKALSDHLTTVQIGTSGVDTFDAGNLNVLTDNRTLSAVWGAGGDLDAVVDDLTPQLGGDLDVNGSDIVSVSNGDINITPDGTGKTVVTALEAPMPQQTQTGTTYTAVLGDADKMITMNNASANTMTIPANASVAYPVGTKLNIMQLGAGATTVAITSDTLNVNASLTAVLNGQYAVATAFKVTATTWVLFGNLVAA